MSEYPQALKVREEKPTDSDEPVSKKPRISSYPKLLLIRCGKCQVPLQEKGNLSTSAVEFDFFTEICQMMGILNSKCRNATSSIFTLLHQLLECILRHDIYQISDDSLNGSVQFSWFKNIVEVLIQTEVPCDAVFQCLGVLLRLNHSLLEPHLETVWTMLWKTRCTTGDARHSLMTSLISTYVKLRQFEKLVCNFGVSEKSGSIHILA
ncbi:rRNA primary transcript metabolism protein [Desmophyllum pertusum]|uniref:rRNA primary transcript metabolism protein n=1 Tax=Desmophyllum pertusum TaxID=174260 RepID=A0A9X0CTP3_9CNID|nr:rRNA primary transcript metabolism protein [Desmophyllum pertusum]